MVQDIFINLSIIIIFAVLISGLMKILKQPLIIGYILTGLIVGPYFLNILDLNESFSTFSQLGVALLLFMVGLHLNPRVIKDVGKISLITGIGQVVFTSVIGFLICKMLGFSVIISFYISVALTFSSTIIIMKLLSDKGDLETLYGRIAIGFLIVQDIIAIFVLMIISSMSNGDLFSSLVFGNIALGIILIIGLFLMSVYILPLLTNFIAKSQEFLFLFSIGWCLALSSLFYHLGFSMEIGALLAGISLSMSPYTSEISSKTKPVRDFFIVMFFIMLGSQMAIMDVQRHFIPIIIFSIFILIGNPLIVMILMGLFGYTKRTSFLAGLTVAQISEFSLILVALGIKVGHLSNETLSLVATVGLITIAGSTYMIIYSNQLYDKLSKYLGIFERKKIKEERKIKKKYDAILFGYNRIGFSILRSLKKIKKNYLVIDFNPDVVSNLSKWGIPCLYGDIDDVDFLNELPLNKIELAVSTVPDFETNALLIESIRLVNKDAIIIVRSHQIKDALTLYNKGASYVLTPHFLGGEYVARMIREEKVNKLKYKEEKEKHINMLKSMMSRGHKHPKVED